jgi:hypothetical protein
MDVPLSYPPDNIWYSAFVIEPSHVSHKTRIERGEARIELESASPDPRVALEWLAEHLTRVNQRAGEMRSRIRKAQTEATAWWENSHSVE